MSRPPISHRILFPRRLSGIRLVEPAKQPPKRAAAAAAAKSADSVPQTSARLEALLTNINQQVATVVQEDGRRMLELQQAAVELALAAADCLASRCVELGKYSVQGMIEQAVRMSGEIGSVVVVLNPKDHELFKDLPDDEVAKLQNVSVQTDPRVSSGECRIQTSSECLSFDVANRMESIRRAWMETLDDAAA